jgi:hypothetical protein
MVIEICQVCGNRVSIGSGRFVNRIPDFDTLDKRIGRNVKYPNGDFICKQCDEDILAYEVKYLLQLVGSGMIKEYKNCNRCGIAISPDIDYCKECMEKIKNNIPPVKGWLDK